jgi:hypothetical protein
MKMIFDTIRGRRLHLTSLRAGPRHTFNAAKLLMAALHEIFDEAAYSRFLTRERAERSRESYAAFLRENEIRVARRPRCC